MPVKDATGFVTHGAWPGVSFEAPLADQQGYLTPSNQFFVCSSGSTPQIDCRTYCLRVWGDGVHSEVNISYDDLLDMPLQTVDALLECAGNHRAFFQNQPGRTLISPPGSAELIWSTGAVGMARWRGVPLRNVLTLAGLRSDALHICSRGSEEDSCEGELRMPMDLSKAMAAETILAVEMNGEVLPPDHGFPVRLLVPGWIGAYSVKWLRDIEVSTRRIWVRRNTVSYTLQGEFWPAEHYAPAAGAPITELNIKSSLALPLSVTLAPGVHGLFGYARSPGTRIDRVEWSDDGGIHWKRAKLDDDNEPFGWVRFSFEWRASSGHRVLMTRATDENGQSQPDSVPFNTGGYLYNAVHPHPVTVA